MQAAPKVVPPVLLHGPTMSEVDAGGTAAEVDPSHSIPLHVVAVWQMTAEGQSDTTASDVEVHMKQRGGIEFLATVAPIGIRWCLLNVDNVFQQWQQWQWVTSTGSSTRLEGK